MTVHTPENIVFATNNAHKLEELREIVGGRLNVLSLSEIGCHDDIPEDAPTLEGNALTKARWVRERYHVSCFADDTGLEVAALAGAPGVHSASHTSTPTAASTSSTAKSRAKSSLPPPATEASATTLSSAPKAGHAPSPRPRPTRKTPSATAATPSALSQLSSSATSPYIPLNKKQKQI